MVGESTGTRWVYVLEFYLYCSSRSIFILSFVCNIGAHYNYVITFHVNALISRIFSSNDPTATNNEL
jgi:hypothetical protein